MIGIIVAYARNRVIGYKGAIPWNLPGEQSRFRQLTVGNVVIMGRRTYEEIGRPLPDRFTIVVSRTKKFAGDTCVTADSLQAALKIAGSRDVFIAGGERLYREALPLAEKLYITEIEADIEGDTFFPEFPKEDFEKHTVEKIGGEIPYCYVTYVRRGETN